MPFANDSGDAANPDAVAGDDADAGEDAAPENASDGGPSFGASGSEFIPRSGAPGTVVLLQGENLIVPASVYFRLIGDGGMEQYPANLVAVHEPTSLEVVVPSMPPGRALLVVDTPMAEVVSSDDFSVRQAPLPPMLAGAEFTLRPATWPPSSRSRGRISTSPVSRYSSAASRLSSTRTPKTASSCGCRLARAGRSRSPS